MSEIIAFNSHLLLGTAGYPSLDELAKAVQLAQPDMVTVSLRREGSGGERFRDFLKQLPCPVLPNTAGCHTAKEAITTAQMARELFNTSHIKLEVIGHDDTLQPDPFGLVEAAQVLCDDGFVVYPYTTDDLIVGERLLAAGCPLLMPWASPIGSGQGLRNIDALKTYRAHFSDVPLVIDAGIRSPSDAAIAMELGFDAILVNTAVAKALHPPQMAQAFADAIQAGRNAREAGIMPRYDMAQPSTPLDSLASLW